MCGGTHDALARGFGSIIDFRSHPEATQMPIIRRYDILTLEFHTVRLTRNFAGKTDAIRVLQDSATITELKSFMDL